MANTREQNRSVSGKAVASVEAAALGGAAAPGGAPAPGGAVASEDVERAAEEVSAVRAIEAAVDDLGAKDDAVGETWWDIAGFFLCVLLIAFVERTLFFQPYNIPSGSMESTLAIGDYLFVEKFAYGYNRNSLPFGQSLPSFGRLLAHSPQRGDVVVFVPPNEPNTVYIKRLIGLPGDRIRMSGGVLYVNGVAVPKVRVDDYQPENGGHAIARYRETLPGGKSYFVLDQIADGPEDNTEIYTVPGGHYFMMGDNRDDSNDSRMDVGFVPAENLVGKAQFRFFSIDDTKTQWWTFWNWPRAIRFGRIFTLIT